MAYRDKDTELSYSGGEGELDDPGFSESEAAARLAMTGSRSDTDLSEPAPGPDESPQVEASDQEPQKRKRSKFSEFMTSLLSGNILSRSEVKRAYPYLIFISILMFIYIGNAFRTQRLYREQARLTEQVRELRSKSMSIASERMQATRQTTIMRELERRGIPLHESLEPNKVIPKQDNGRR